MKRVVPSQRTLTTRFRLLTQPPARPSPFQQPQRQQQLVVRSFTSKQLIARRAWLSSYCTTPIRRCVQRLRQVRFQSTKPPPGSEPTPPKPNVTPNLGSPDAGLSFSQRMRKLSREYGWAAFGVYMGLSALDFPFCFLAVRALGTDRIGHWEHEIVRGFWRAVDYAVPQLSKYAPESARDQDGLAGALGSGQSRKGSGQAVAAGAEGQAAEWTWGVEEAEEKHKADATIWTQLALAYAVHKSFIFIRVPLTVAVTPKVVKTLRGWGWNIGKRKPKTAASSTSASS